MKKCSQCQRILDEDEGRGHLSEILCDDCYIDRIWPKVFKTFYENEPSEFMRRLKESSPVHPQKFH